MTGWDVAPGQWEMTQGIDSDNDDVADSDGVKSDSFSFERSRGITLTLPPRATTVMTFKLMTPGVPYWERPDLGIDRRDVTRTAGGVHVVIHSLGSVQAPATDVVLKGPSGDIIAGTRVSALPAPIDLLPKTADVQFALAEGRDLTGCTIEIDPEHTLQEITTRNNSVRW